MISLLENIQLYDPQYRGRQNLLVAGGKIVWIGQDIPKLDEGLNVQRINFKGKRLIPGFIDAHAHITGGGGESGYASRVPPLALSEFTKHGVTTVVGVLGTDDITRNTSTLVTQARGLSEEGISAYCHTGGYHIPPTTLTGSVRSDIVHIDRIIGVGEIAISDHRSSQPTIDELLRIASEAHVAGIMAGKAGILHIHMGDGERGLQLINQALDISEIPARVFNPTHVNRNRALFDQSMQLTKRGCHIDITAFPKMDGDPGLSADQALAECVDNDIALSQVTISSDGGGCIPLFNESGQVTKMDVGTAQMLPITLKALLAKGYKLETCLPSLTKNVAELLRLPNKGQITLGNDADLIVLDEHNDIEAVMAMGQWHWLEKKQLRYGQFENHE